MKRRNVLVVLAVSLSLATGSATGQTSESEKNFPNKLMRIVVPFAAGGAADMIARLLAERLFPIWKQPVIVDNRPGASGSIGAQQVAGSPPDGHTILFTNTGMLQNAILYPTLPVDPLRDFTPISRVVNGPLAFVVGAQGNVSTMAQYVSTVRSRPGQLSYASYGMGSTSHIYGELLKSVAQLDLTHVAYRGEAAALPDVINGNVTGAFLAAVTAASASKGGRVKVLAVAGTAPSIALPGVPTFQELGMQGFEGVGWFGLFAPAATPKPLVERISRDVNHVLADPELVRRVNAAGMDTAGSTPDEFASLMRIDFERWNKLIKQFGIKGE
jgi:tripartite-type tricarboxylate transporter receptor subunit TctC